MSIEWMLYNFCTYVEIFLFININMSREGGLIVGLSSIHFFFWLNVKMFSSLLFNFYFLNNNKKKNPSKNPYG